MFNRIARLYSEQKITDAGLINAVYKSWITAEEYKKLTNKEYVPPTPVITYTLDEAATILAMEVNK